MIITHVYPQHYEEPGDLHTALPSLSTVTPPPPPPQSEAQEAVARLTVIRHALAQTLRLLIGLY